MACDLEWTPEITGLRLRAEREHAQRESERPVGLQESDGPARLLHELEVHRIELEMQNDSLRDAESALRASAERYRDLFDTAPVGFLTLDRRGTIVAANQRLCDMLAADRDQLVGRPLQAFMEDHDADELHRHLHRVFDAHAEEACELRVKPAVEGREPVFVHLQSGWRPGADAVEGECSSVLLELAPVVLRPERAGSGPHGTGEASGPPAAVGLVGRSPAMVCMMRSIERIAPSDASVLIQGETGVGKEVVARLIHEMSPRRAGPFVAVHCAAFPEGLIEAELFGHTRGAFTGATGKREGRFQAAHGGTLLLDEVGEVSPALQAKLLRVLQEWEVEPLGGNAAVRLDVRVLCATHRDLKQMVAEGTFREDLYYRLKVLTVRVPPLREREGDLAPLVSHFLARFSDGAHGELRMTPRAWQALLDYPFPGNVRELEHAVHHALVLAGGKPIDLGDLPEDICNVAGPGAAAADDACGPCAALPPLGESLRAYERKCLVRALEHVNGRRGAAAVLLGISRKSLWEKMKAYRITSPTP